MIQVNSRADLEQLRDTPAFVSAMKAVYGSLVGWTLVDGAWEQSENTAVLDRLGFTKAAFMAEIEGFDFPAPVAPPLVTPASPYVPLKPYQFWGAVRATDNEQRLKDWVATIADPAEQGVASAMLEFSLEFRRDHPLMEAARVALEMSETELNDLWIWGLTL